MGDRPTSMAVMIDFAEVRRLPRQAVRMSPWKFPPAQAAGEDGFLAMGADFEPGTMLEAYCGGIFPWPNAGLDTLWWSPERRAVLEPHRIHISRRMARTIRQHAFTVTINTAFTEVIDACTVREDGTWITPALRDAFIQLHGLGWAHSVEVWTPDGVLAGGLYGLAIGGLFAAESMFHTARDMSKVALIALAQQANRRGIDLIDAQFLTPHLASMGFTEIERADYVDRLSWLTQRGGRFP